MKEEAINWLKNAKPTLDRGTSSDRALIGIGYAILELCDAIRTLDTSEKRTPEDQE